MLLKALLISLAVVVATQNTGNKLCVNFRGETETCGVLQFCSTSESFEKGCRNCTDIYEKWCGDESRVAEFKTRYPECAILCKVKGAHDELGTAKAEIRRLSDEKASLETTVVGLAVGVGAAALLAMTLACLLVWQKAQNVRASGNAEGTAAPEHKGVWEKLVGCLWNRVRSPQPASSEQETIELRGSRV